MIAPIEHCVHRPKNYVASSHAALQLFSLWTTLENKTTIALRNTITVSDDDRALCPPQPHRTQLRSDGYGSSQKIGRGEIAIAKPT